MPEIERSQGSLIRTISDALDKCHIVQFRKNPMAYHLSYPESAHIGVRLIKITANEPTVTWDAVFDINSMERNADDLSMAVGVRKMLEELPQQKIQKSREVHALSNDFEDSLDDDVQDLVDATNRLREDMNAQSKTTRG